MSNSIFQVKKFGKYPIPFYRFAAAAIVVLTMIIGGSLTWNVYNIKQHVRELAIDKARTHAEKDQAFRVWATKHGGVYVPVSDRTPPNLYLLNVHERDIITPLGTHLTLMNPAYMMRQMNEEYPKSNVSGNITSLNLLRPENKPDDWERSALLAFEQGVKEVSDFVDFQGKSHLRWMQPMITQKPCLKCHEAQGYKEGDVRGGLSVSVSMAPYLAIESKEKKMLLLTHYNLLVGS